MSSPRELPEPTNVLIVKPSSLGDVISAIPVLRGLRRSFPSCRVSWMVTPGCRDVLEGQGLDEIIPFDRKRFGRIGRSVSATGEFVRFCQALRGRRFDWVLDLQGLFRSGFLSFISGAAVRAGFSSARELAGVFYTHRFTVSSRHTIDRNIELARFLGIDARAEDLRLEIPAAWADYASQAMAQHGLTRRGFAVFSPGTRWANKAYPVRHWRRLIGLLGERLGVVLIGAPNDRALCGQVAQGLSGVADLSGQTSVGQVAALMAQAAVVVCSDSSANFIAPAVGTPFVTLLGPTRPERTGPYGELGKALAANVPCLGCLRRSCPHATCMQMIEPERVLAAMQRVMGDRTLKAV